MTCGFTTTAIVDVPPLAAMDPANVQLMVPTGLVPLPGAHVQPVPVAETRFKPGGTASATVALVAARLPMLLTVIV